MKVLVCGGREYRDVRRVYNELDRLHSETPITLIIHGGADGADRLAGDWAHDRNIECTVYKADWKTYGRSAGPRRNSQMLTEGKPDLVVAFPGGIGTADMCDKARRAGVRIVYV
jgi:hypothetical protein